MRFSRLSAITVLLLACVVLGTACAGAKGEQGVDGVGVENVAFNADGTMTINLTNGEEYTSPNLTGPQGEKGDAGAQGVQGPQGIQGVAGPNWIAAMGSIDSDATVHHSYNVENCSWNAVDEYYLIDLPFEGSYPEYVVLLSDYSSLVPETIVYSWIAGDLHVHIFDTAGQRVTSAFCFCILRMS